MGATQIVASTRSGRPDAADAADAAAGADLDVGENSQSTAGRLVSAVLEWIVIAVGSLFLALLIRLFLLQSFYIPSGSMQNTLTVNDRVLVNKLSYDIGSPSRGDIVVFNRPPNLSGDMNHLIKRVIAIEGDTVEGRNGDVLINGVVIDEPYVEQGVLTSTFAVTKIGEGEVWVMGDNRTNSADSRVFGAIQESSLIGRSFIQIWPISDIELL